MTILAIQAAKYLGQKSDWKYSNLELQKIIYITHVFHLGEEHTPLVYGNFEAWDYGPVHPELYHFLKVFGARPVPRSFGLYDFVEDVQEGTESKWLDGAAKALPPGNGPRLVAITRRDQGAWMRHSASNVKRCVIPSESILTEYQSYQNE